MQLQLVIQLRKITAIYNNLEHGYTTEINHSQP